MRRAVGLVVVVAVALAAASAVHANAGALGWVAVVCVGLGAALGAAYARSRRGWADYRYTRRQVPILRRSFLGSAGRTLFWMLVLGSAMLAAIAGARGR